MIASLEETIEDFLEDLDYMSNPYFVQLQNGDFTRADFLETQIQFYFAVDFFPRPMSALAAKIPTHDRRLEVLENVFEEHGEGEPEEFHKNTFLEFLHRLGGITKEDVESRALWPEVRHFNTTLAGACVMDEYIVGVGMMGMIERMFVDISAAIGQAVLDRGWLDDDELIHYNLHKELDLKHAEDFFEILEEPWKESERNQYYIKQGLKLGGYAFNDMYEGLYKNRKNREQVDRSTFTETSNTYF